MALSGTYGKVTKYADNGRAHPFVVYLALNTVNGDFYIGATEKGTARRSDVHRWQANHGRGQYFYRAIRKYGADSFRFITIKECVDFWDALESERAYIALMNPTYNMTAGGGGIKGHRHSEESKAKMSAAKKGKPARKKSDEEIRRASELRKGISYTPTESQVEAMRVNAALANEARRKGVICLTDGLVYGSITEAAYAYGMTTGQISYHCKGDHKSRRGLEFRYLESKNDK